jgi:RNA polymerase sigma-70 factor (ECF subfamily)
VKRVLSEDISKDLVQEAFLAAWRNIDGYKREASVKTWLFVILKSKLIDYYRKSNNRVVIESLQEEHNDNAFFDNKDHWRRGMPGQWNVDFSNNVEVQEFYKVFHDCGKKLKEIQSNVFIMKYIDGLESEEICKVLEITTSNYWVLIHRAKVQLRACLEKNWVQK